MSIHSVSLDVHLVTLDTHPDSSFQSWSSQIFLGLINANLWSLRCIQHGRQIKTETFPILWNGCRSQAASGAMVGRTLKTPNFRNEYRSKNVSTNRHKFTSQPKNFQARITTGQSAKSPKMTFQWFVPHEYIREWGSWRAQRDLIKGEFPSSVGHGNGDN